MRRIAGLATLALLASCEIPLTQFVVGVDTDLTWGPGGELESVVLEVRRGGAEGLLRDRRTTALGTNSGRTSLALWVSIAARDPGDASPLWLEALGCAQPDGCTRDTAVVVQRATVRFARQQSGTLQMLLARSCATARCTLAERCDVSNGRCVPGDASGEVRPLGRILPGRFGSGRTSGDGGVSSDAVVEPDAVVAMDAGGPSDGAVASDAVAAPDTTTGVDAVAPRDVVTAMDVVAPRDVVTAMDVVAPRDVVTAMDVVAPRDVVTAMDVVDAAPPRDVVCGTGTLRCGWLCRDLQQDPLNCGACGRACAAGQGCLQGVCAPSVGVLCPSGMILVPGGSFVMGAPTDEPESLSTERPQHRVTLNSFCLARAEVTVVDYQRCVAAGGCLPPLGGTGCNENMAGRQSHPINCIEWNDAVSVCSFLYPAGRLPTEAEWEFAATVAGTRRYPWGDTPPSNQLCWSGVTMRTSSCPIEAFPAGATPTGVQDLLGSVGEWVADRYDAYDAADQVNPSGPSMGTEHVVRGNGWSERLTRSARSRYRHSIPDGYGTGSVGVRCAAGAR
ncbi:MAG: SUMF1/EgtB/PvdO family nonheme iron enzyme [Polyangiales bacterium]